MILYVGDGDDVENPRLVHGDAVPGILGELVKGGCRGSVHLFQESVICT